MESPASDADMSTGIAPFGGKFFLCKVDTDITYYFGLIKDGMETLRPGGAIGGVSEQTRTANWR